MADASATDLKCMISDSGLADVKVEADEIIGK